MRDWAAARERAGERQMGRAAAVVECEVGNVGEPIAESARELCMDDREKLRVDVGM